MFKVAYDKNTKLVMAVGNFSPIPDGCSVSEMIKGQPPYPTHEMDADRKTIYLYRYDEVKKTLLPARGEPVVIVP